MTIEINKDLEKYQESIMMGLNAKQLCFSVLSVLVGGGIILLLYPYIGLTVAAYVAIPIVAPIALGGFYSFHGMSVYEVMKRKLHFAFGNRPLTYVSTEGEFELRAYQREVEQQKRIATKKNRRKQRSRARRKRKRRK